LESAIFSAELEEEEEENSAARRYEEKTLKERKPEINTKSNEVHREDSKLLSRTKLGLG
jgi:hypothetical protein